MLLAPTDVDDRHHQDHRRLADHKVLRLWLVQVDVRRLTQPRVPSQGNAPMKKHDGWGGGGQPTVKGR